MEEKKLVPKRRFEGFAKVWEQYKLEDLAEISTGYAFSSNQFNSNGKYLVVTNKNIQDQDKGIPSFGDRIDIHDNDMIEKFKLNGINVLVTMDGVNIGETGKYKNDKAVLAQRVGRLNSDSIEFIYQITKLKKFRLEMNRISVGNAIKHISLRQIADYSFLAPTLIEEQQKMGEFFKVLDERIANQERKIAKVKALKSAYLTEMFPQEGDTIPRRRFEGFKEKWVRRRVGEIFQVTRGNVLSTTKITKKQSKKSRYPVYSSQTQNNGLLGYYSDYLFDTAITWTTDGANAGTVNYREGKFYSTNVNGVLISKEGYACKAVAEILDLEAWKHVSKVGNPKLMNNVMSSIEILIPNNIKELELLSLFFKNLDDQITTEEKKLEKLKQMKEAYLEEMFV